MGPTGGYVRKHRWVSGSRCAFIEIGLLLLGQVLAGVVPALHTVPCGKDKGVFSSHQNPRHYVKKKFFVTSNLRYMHGVLNVDEIKN